MRGTENEKERERENVRDDINFSQKVSFWILKMSESCRLINEQIVSLKTKRMKEGIETYFLFEVKISKSASFWFSFNFLSSSLGQKGSCCNTLVAIGNFQSLNINYPIAILPLWITIKKIIILKYGTS